MPDLTDLCFLLQDRLHRQDLAEASAPAVVENSISQYFFRRLKHSEVCHGDVSADTLLPLCVTGLCHGDVSRGRIR